MSDDDEAMVAPPEQPSPVVVELETVVGSAFSTDGEAFMVQMADADGDPVLIQLPTAQFDNFLRAVATLKDSRAKAGGRANQMVLRNVREVGVGHMDENPGHLALVFEPHTPAEQAFLLPDAEAIRLIDRITKDLRSRNDDKTRAHRMMAPKLILPPGFNQ